MAYRVVADHIRTLTCAITDGALPDNCGRGFVLRRIVRRAIRFGHEFLGAREGFLSELVAGVQKTLGPAFPELNCGKTLAKVAAVLREEETAFARTYTTGMRHFDALAQRCVDTGVVPGVEAFILHDRYGFPMDLTKLMADARGLSLDESGFYHAMERHKKEAGEKAKAGFAVLDPTTLDTLRREGVPATKDEAKYDWGRSLEATVVAIVSTSSRTLVQHITGSTEEFAVLLDRTNFYAEAGGQIYDTGTLTPGFVVTKVSNQGGYVCHVGGFSSSDSGSLTVGETITTEVDLVRRHRVAANHTMTHQLNHALRAVLQLQHPESGEVHQRGSYVGEDALRFDFSWGRKLELEELREVENRLCSSVAQDLRVHTRELPLAVAQGIPSLRSAFDEKYGDIVKVVTIGIPVEEVLEHVSDADYLLPYSIELCGGTHLRSLSEVGSFVLLSEDALMRGIRRIVAVSGDQAVESIALGVRFEDELRERSAHLQCLADDITRISTGELDDTVKALSKLRDTVNASTSPLLVKHKLREGMDAQINLANGLKRKHEAARLVIVEELAQRHATSLSSDTQWTILGPCTELPPSRDLVQRATSVLLSSNSRLCGVFAVGYDFSKKCGLVVTQVRPGYSTGQSSGGEVTSSEASAVAWVKASVGKGGGKESCAQGGFQGDAQSVREKATEYAGKFFRSCK